MQRMSEADALKCLVVAMAGAKSRKVWEKRIAQRLESCLRVLAGDELFVRAVDDLVADADDFARVHELLRS